MSVLRERMQKDPNTYIRLQSAAAIRDIGPRREVLEMPGPMKTPTTTDSAFAETNPSQFWWRRLLSFCSPLRAPQRDTSLPRQAAAPNDAALTSDLTGSIAVHDGDHIRVKTDLGNIVDSHAECNQLGQDGLARSSGDRRPAEGRSAAAEELHHCRAHDRRRRAAESRRPGTQGRGPPLGNAGNRHSEKFQRRRIHRRRKYRRDEIEGRVGLATAGGNITAGNIGGAGAPGNRRRQHHREKCLAAS